MVTFGYDLFAEKTTKLLEEYKFKLKHSEQELNYLRTVISRLESQLERYKTLSKEADKRENELILEKRQLLKEVRTCVISYH
jgi:leucine-rich repeat flightless-interacting protein 2